MRAYLICKVILLILISWGWLTCIQSDLNWKFNIVSKSKRNNNNYDWDKLWYESNFMEFVALFHFIIISNESVCLCKRKFPLKCLFSSFFFFSVNLFFLVIIVDCICCICTSWRTSSLFHCCFEWRSCICRQLTRAYSQSMSIELFFFYQINSIFRIYLIAFF